MQSGHLCCIVPNHAAYPAKCSPVIHITTVSVFLWNVKQCGGPAKTFLGFWFDGSN
jgi:hypothetical protein